MSKNFTKRGKYPWNVYVDKDSFLTLVNYLEAIGFTNISVKLPLHEGTSERGSEKGIDLPEFLERDRNYKALILVAVNKSDEIRILFRNSGKVEFYDDIFPTANTDLTYNYYICSKDISKTYSIHFFIMDFFTDHKVVSSDFFIPVIVPVAGLIAFAVSQTQKFLGQSGVFIFIVIVFLFTIVGVRFLPQTGLYFHNPQDARPFSTALLKLREQWLILLVGGIVTFGLGLLGTYIGHLLGW